MNAMGISWRIALAPVVVSMGSGSVHHRLLPPRGLAAQGWRGIPFRAP